MTEFDAEARRGGLGASDLAKADTGHYGGAVAVVGAKLGLVADEIDPELADRGHRWEHRIADGVRAHYGYVVAGEQMRLTHKANPRLFCHPDGLLIPEGVELELANVGAGLEIKTRNPRAKTPWDYYEAQAQASMLVGGLPRWLVAVATVDQDYSTATGQTVEVVTNITYRWVERDEYRCSQLEALAAELWAWVEKGELPPATGPDALPWVKAATMTAGQICPDCEGDGKHRGGGRRVKCERCEGSGRANIDEPPELGDELSALISRRQALALAMKASQDEADTIEAQLRQAIGQATEVRTTDGAWRVRCGLPVRKFTSQSEADFLELHGPKAIELGLLRTVLDRDRTKELMGDEYDALRIATPDRRLTVKDLRPEDHAHD